jgi:uncharacterized membrane protein YeiH
LLVAELLPQVTCLLYHLTNLIELTPIRLRLITASCNLDLLGAVALGTLTAVGGGTIRDVIIMGRTPFWSGKDGEEEYLWLSLFAAGLTFFLYPKDEFRKVFDHEAMEWSDSLGLGAFAVIG